MTIATMTDANPIPATSDDVNPTSAARGTIASVPTAIPTTAPYDHRSRRVSHGVKRFSAAMPGAASAARSRSETRLPAERVMTA